MTTDDAELIEEMFVQVARGATSADGMLTLSGISPSTLYFSDRPERVVGHMTNAQFVELWAADTPGENTFASDPPNAVLSFVDEGGPSFLERPLTRRPRGSGMDASRDKITLTSEELRILAELEQRASNVDPKLRLSLTGSPRWPGPTHVDFATLRRYCCSRLELRSCSQRSRDGRSSPLLVSHSRQSH